MSLATVVSLTTVIILSLYISISEYVWYSFPFLRTASDCYVYFGCANQWLTLLFVIQIILNSKSARQTHCSAFSFLNLLSYRRSNISSDWFLAYSWRILFVSCHTCQISRSLEKKPLRTAKPLYRGFLRKLMLALYSR